jgi:hypothetical protein
MVPSVPPPTQPMEASLPARSMAPALDATVVTGEYSVMYDFPRLDLYLSRTAGHLHAAVVADTRGWVAVGLGSHLMDGSRIMFGFVVDRGPVFVEQVGTDHEHTDTEQPLQAEAAVGEVGRRTTLEVRVPWAAVEPLLQDDVLLPVITAYGTQDSLTQIHRFQRTVVARLEPGAPD